jgi:hypothetical protein
VRPKFVTKLEDNGIKIPMTAFLDRTRSLRPQAKEA